MIRSSTVLLAAVCLAPLSGWADKETIIVYLDGEGCPEYTLTDEKNCDADADHERNKSCRKPGQKVGWELADKSFGEEITISWKGDNPMEESCKMKSNGGKIAKCQIRGDVAEADYEYSVVAPRCELDPRIVIRH